MSPPQKWRKNGDPLTGNIQYHSNHTCIQSTIYMHCVLVPSPCYFGANCMVKHTRRHFCVCAPSPISAIRNMSLCSKPRYAISARKRICDQRSSRFKDLVARTVWRICVRTYVLCLTTEANAYIQSHIVYNSILSYVRMYIY